MKILITGGGGFVGSRLAARLLARGRSAAPRSTASSSPTRSRRGRR